MGYTGWQNRTAQEFEKLMAGAQVDENVVNIEHSIWYHRLVYAAAGTAGTYRFFNVSDGDSFESNWAGPNGLGQDTAMMCLGFGFQIEVYSSVAGDEVAGAEPLGQHATALTQFAFAAEILGIIETGKVEFRVGKQIKARGYGLTSFPGGGGACLNAAVATNSATTLVLGAAHVTNGVPLAGNFYRFDRPVAILPQKEVSVTWQTESTRDIAAAFAIKCCLFGPTLYPSNS